jgi:CheY-like chemotaxis protein
VRFALSDKLIMVVDDDAEAREALSEFLQVNGYSVRSAENGQAALNEISVRHQIPALILLDLMMPVMDGRTFISRARQENEIRNVPIVVITAHPSTDLPNANAILPKPVKPENLLLLVRKFVGAIALN